MIAKKSPQADLERKRFAFLKIGLVLSCSFCLIAFEFSTFKKNQNVAQNLIETDTVVSVYEIPQELKPIQQQKNLVVRAQIINDINEVKHEVKTEPSVNKNKNIDLETVEFCDDCEENEGTIKKTVDYDPIVFDPGKFPEFPGGLNEMSNFINKHFYNYLPEYAERLSGTIYVSFVVDKDGSITKISLLKGIHEDYDKAAIAVVNKMPKWIPGEHYGKPVKVQMNLPIKVKNY